MSSEKELNWSKERAAFIDRISNLEKVLETERRKQNRDRDEINGLKQKLDESLQRSGSLDEYSASDMYKLAKNLREAEAIITESRTKVKVILSELSDLESAGHSEKSKDNRDLTSKVSHASTDNSINAEIKTKLKLLENELMKYEHLRDSLHRDQTDQLADKDDQLRSLEMAASQLENELLKLKKENKMLRKQQHDTVRNSLTLQNDLARAEGQIHAYTINSNQFNSSNEQLKQLLDHIATKFAVHSRKMFDNFNSENIHLRQQLHQLAAKLAIQSNKMMKLKYLLAQKETATREDSKREEILSQKSFKTTRFEDTNIVNEASSNKSSQAHADQISAEHRTLLLEYEKLRNYFDLKEKEMTFLNEKLESKDADLRRSNDKVKQLESSLAQTQEKLSKLDQMTAMQSFEMSKLHNLSDAEKDNELKLRSQRIIELELSLKQAQQQQRVYEEDLNTKKKSRDESSDQLLSENQNLRSQIEELTSSLSRERNGLKDQIYNKDVEINSLNNRLRQAEERFRQVQFQERAPSTKFTNNEELKAENNYLRMQLDQTKANSLQQAQEISMLMAKFSQQELESSRRSFTRDSDDTLAQARQKLAQIEKAEIELTAELKAFGEMLVSGVLSEGTGLLEGDEKESSYVASNFVDPDSRLLSIRRMLLSVKEKARLMEIQRKRSKESRNFSRDEVEHLKDEISALKQQISQLTSDRSSLVERLETHMGQITTMASENRKATEERDALSRSLNDLNHRTRNIVRNLDSVVVDVLSKAGVIIASKGERIHFNHFQLLPGRDSFDLTSNKSASDEITSYLSRAVNDVMNAFNSLCQSLESLADDSITKKRFDEKMEAVLREKESIWLKERVAIMERMTALESTLELERKNFTTNQIDGKALLAEIDVLKKQLSEATQKHIDAQAELLRALNAIEELKISMLECENQLMETRARIQSLLADLKVRDDEIKSLHDNVDIERKKVMEGLLQLEKEKCLVDKLNFEKDAMEKLHQNLQKEIERTQTEAHNFSLEVEKLLASLGSVFDQISSDPNPLRDPNTPFFFVTPMLSGSAISDKNNAPQAERVEYAIKRLSDMRIWCRDELRTRRVLEERYETVQREVAASQITINDNQNEIKRLQTRCNNVEGEIKVKVKEINEMQSAIAFKEEELERMKHVLRLALVKFHLK